MEKRKNRTAAVIIFSVVIIYIALAVTFTFIPYKMTALSSSLKNCVDEDIKSITVVVSPCCGPMEGARRTYTCSSHEFIANFKTASKDAVVQKNFIMRAGGSDVQFTIVTDANTYEVNFHQGNLKTFKGEYRINNPIDWQFIYEYPEDTLIETEF